MSTQYDGAGKRNSILSNTSNVASDLIIDIEDYDAHIEEDENQDKLTDLSKPAILIDTETAPSEVQETRNNTNENSSELNRRLRGSVTSTSEENAELQSAAHEYQSKIDQLLQIIQKQSKKLEELNSLMMTTVTQKEEEKHLLEKQQQQEIHEYDKKVRQMLETYQHQFEQMQKHYEHQLKIQFEKYEYLRNR
jgi:predicted RNase H-like nuclease (RuvC/YqgF family)